MHVLQQLFADAEGEQAFHDELRALCEAREFHRAEAFLTEQLQTMDTEIAQLCLDLPRDAVVVSGWEDLVEAIAAHEGEPITAVTLALVNQLDIAFEKGKLHEPYVTLGLYTDEAYRFSAATPRQLHAECLAADGPGWADREEDIEIYLEVEGFGPLNTALTFHKQRHFFRDDNPETAPMRYVDYVVGYWWRALRFQQAIAEQYERHRLPGGIPAIAGMVDMRPELICVHTSAQAVAATAAVPAQADEEDDEPSVVGLITRKPLEDVQELTGSSLRRRFAGSEEAAPEVVRKGFLGRLFGRGGSLEDAA